MRQRSGIHPEQDGFRIEVPPRRRLLGGDELPGSLVSVPAETKHCLRNAGQETARLLIYLDQAKDVVTFDEPLMPIDTSVVASLNAPSRKQGLNE